MVTSNFDTLKELKQHGNRSFPVSLYVVNHANSGMILPLHWHNELEFIYLQSGHATFLIGEDRFELNPHEALFVPAQTLHSGFSDSDLTSYSCLVFRSDFLMDPIDSFAHNFEPMVSNKQLILPHYQQAIHAQQEVLSTLNQIIEELKEKKTAYELKVKSLLLSLFTTIFRNHLYSSTPVKQLSSSILKKQRTIKQILDFIDQNYTHKITLENLSQAVNLSPQYLCILFKQMTHTKIIDYVNHYRIEHALSLLNTHELSITDIALECGFDNISYFNRIFKRQIGCTPTEFRQRI